MYARSQLLIWTAIIFMLNLVLLVKLRDNAATARTQLEELTPTELIQIDITNMLGPNSVASQAQADEPVTVVDQVSAVTTENAEELLDLHPESTSAGSVTVYYVHKGDTLWQISRRHNLDLRTLLAYNKLKDPNLIRPGQRIEIPRRYTNMQVIP